MGELRPVLGDIRLSFDLIARSGEPQILDDLEYRCLMTLVGRVAASLVWTYDAPTDGSLEDDDAFLAKYCRVRPRAWARVRPKLEQFFVIEGGRWHLNRPWIEIDQATARFAIPLDIREKVLVRDGRRCSYCGDTEGPHEFDHIMPVVLGGSNDTSNLTVACKPCNASKGGRTLAQWIADRLARQ